MSLVSGHLETIEGHKEISRSVKNLQQQVWGTVNSWAYLEGTLNNKNCRKLDGSFSGHALEPMVANSARLIVLSINRIWERQQDNPVTILSELLKVGPKIEEMRTAAHPNWPREALEIGNLSRRISQTKQEAEEFLNSPLYRELRVFRSEYLSHSLEGVSRDRQRLNFDKAVAAPKYDEVLNAIRATAEIVRSISLYWFFDVPNFSDWVKIRKRQTIAFWELLPVLSEAEEGNLEIHRLLFQEEAVSQSKPSE